MSKAGDLLPAGAMLRLRGEPMPYVSRGGLKLAHAIETFKVDVAGAVAVDIGASTGGFTDCLLQRGAARVYCIDVGHGQLDWKIASDPRVTIIDRTNIRHMPPERIPERCTLAVIDVSFISLRLVLPVLPNLLVPGASALVLVKPQFEVGREKVGKGGIIRDEDDRSRPSPTWRRQRRPSASPCSAKPRRRSQAARGMWSSCYTCACREVTMRAWTF